MRSFLLCVFCVVSIVGFAQKNIPVRLFPVEGEAYDKGTGDMHVVLQVSYDTTNIYFQIEVTDDRVVTDDDTDRLDIWLGVEKYNYLRYNDDDVLTKPFEDSTINWMDENERKTYYLNNRSWNYKPDSITQQDIDEVTEQLLFMSTTHWQLYADGKALYIQDSVTYLNENGKGNMSPYGSLAVDRTETGYILSFNLDKKGLGMLHRYTYDLFFRLEVTDIDKKGRTTRYSTDSVGNGGVPMYLDERIPVFLSVGSDALPFSMYGLEYFFEEDEWQPYKVLMEQKRWFSHVGQLLLQKLKREKETLYFDSIPYKVVSVCGKGSFGESYGETKLSFDHPKLNGSVTISDGTCADNNHTLYQLNHGHYALLTSEKFSQRGDGFGTCGGCPEEDMVYYITDSTGKLKEAFRIHTNEGMMTYNIPGTSGQGWLNIIGWSDDKTTFIMDVEEDMEKGYANKRYYLEFDEAYTEYSIRTELVAEE